MKQSLLRGDAESVRAVIGTLAETQQRQAMMASAIMNIAPFVNNPDKRGMLTRMAETLDGMKESLRLIYTEAVEDLFLPNSE